MAAGSGLQVSEAIKNPDGTKHLRVFQHTAFLLNASTDSPARQKMALWPPVAAYLACGWCLFEGYKREGETATHFSGYAAPAEQHILGLPDAKVGDASLQVSDALQHQRAERVENGSLNKSRTGCSGYSVFPQTLSYISYSDFWELPIFHAGKLKCQTLMHGHIAFATQSLHVFNSKLAWTLCRSCK